MSRRRNGTNRAGAATGGNRYQGGYNRPKKCTAGAATPNGAEENKSRNNYNIPIPVEQEKMQKIMELIQLAVSINGLWERRQELTDNLPTVFVSYSGHVSRVTFSIYLYGWFPEDYLEEKTLRISEPIEKFNESYDTIKAWLLEIKQGVPNDV